MLETTMYVRCTHCGYDNSPEYRFCGMCGASLAHPPAPIAAPPERAVAPPVNSREADFRANELRGNETRNNDSRAIENRNTENHSYDTPSESVHGPSFLGLAEDPKVEFHYLYEDEQPRSRVGVVVFLLLILGAAGALGWQWHNGGFPFNRQYSSGQSASPSEVAPAMSQNQETHIDKPMTGVGDVVPTAPDQKSVADSGPKSVDLPPPGGKAPDANASGQPSRPESSALKPAPPQKTETAEAEPEPAVAEKPTQQASTRSRVPAAKPAPKPSAAVAALPDTDLEQSGERYLYGTGVPQSCSRAESSLRTAATHGNTKAQTVLGTMYATGHCVGRDLPTAYRWFARALHQEPQNSRISADLQVLWRQMTPQEKQLATASGGQ